MKSIQIRAAKGMRNDVAPERFSHDEFGKVTTYVDLLDSVNLDLDESGKLQRRGGVVQLSASPSHSLWADEKGMSAYVVMAGAMTQFSAAAAFVPMSPALSIAGHRVSYARVKDSVYCSDGVANYQLDGTSARAWGVVVPATPVLAPTVGQLRAGRYLVSVTYVRDDGSESGAPVSSMVVVGDAGGISVSGLSVSADPTVLRKYLYVSDCNGEDLYLAASLMNSDTTATVQALSQQGMTLRTQFFGPLPAGQVVGYHSGRLYVASEGQLWYSAPYEYGLCDLRSGYVLFDQPIRTFAAVSDGIFIGTTSEMYWLSGTDPTEFKLEKRAAFGSVLGTERVIRSDVVLESGAAGAAVCWMGAKGACFGFTGGSMKNMTGALFAPPEASEGAGLLKIRGGTPQYLVTLFA